MQRHAWCAIAVGAALAGGAGFPSVAAGQESIFMEAATQPAKDRLALRQWLTYSRLEGGPRDVEIDEFRLITRLTYALERDLTVSATVPLVHRIDQTDSDGDIGKMGLGDSTLTLKWRFWQEDTGAIDTARLAVFGGAELPTGMGSLSSHSVDPIVGAVFTTIRGRHGFNQSVAYKLTTGTDPSPIRAGAGRADQLMYDTSYLFRLSPAEYGPETQGALYAVAELHGSYETNGDNEIHVMPGILWEGRRYALEAGVMLPVVKDVRRRAEQRIGVVAGWRLLF